MFSVKVRTYTTVQGEPTCICDCECKTRVQEEKGRKIRKIDKIRQNLLLQDPTGKTCPPDLTQKQRNQEKFKYIEYLKPPKRNN